MRTASAHRYGDGASPSVSLRLKDKRIERQLVVDPELALGEAYMYGRLEMIRAASTIFSSCSSPISKTTPCPVWTRSFSAARYLEPAPRCSSIPSGRARRNVAHHYDINGAIYDLFLDRDRQYSCAYFTEGADLEEAQLAKKRHLAAKLAIEPGQRVLDIGSGWGGLGLYLAKAAHCDVTGVTLSREQLKISRERAAREGLSRAVQLRVQGLSQGGGPVRPHRLGRHVRARRRQPLSRPTSARCASCSANDGVALIHTIGRSEPPTATNPFIAKYIFPGGYIPALSEMVAAVERSGLIITDLEILRLHYARDAARLAPALPRQLGQGRRDPGRDLLPDVGVLPRRLRDGLPLPEPRRVPAAAHQAHRGPADHPRLHVQG